MNANRVFLAHLLLVSSLWVTRVAAAQTPSGPALFQAHCAMCHNDTATGANRAPSPALLASKTQEEILRALESGLMVIYGNRLTEVERKAIAASLSSNPGNSAAQAKANLCTVKQPIPADALSSPEKWNGWGVDIVNSRYQTHTSLTAENISRLKLKWAFGVPDTSTAYGQPTIVGGRLFIGSGDGQVYALDAKTGCTIWVYQAETTVRTAVTVGPASRRGNFLAYFADGEANLYAVDASTGALAWKMKTDAHRTARITGAATLYDGRLYVGAAGNEELSGGDPDYPCCTFRGSVTAVDALTGKMIWKGYAISEEPHQARPGESHAKFTPAGAAIWDSPTIDVKLSRIYVGTGDAYVDPAPQGTDAIMAFDLVTGKRLWVEQKTPDDVFNFGCVGPQHINCPPKPGPDVDFGSSPILADLGNGRRVLLAGQKTGVMYGLDPDRDGKQLWQVRIGQGSGLGGIEWGSASDGKYVYAANSDISTLTPLAPGAPARQPGGLAKIEASTGQLIWKVMPPEPACAAKPGCSAGQLAAVTLIPGVVLSASMDGHLRAYSTENGNVIWDFDTEPEFRTVNGVEAHGGSISGSGPVVVGDMVYITSGFDVTAGMPGNLLLAFKLEMAPTSDH